MCVYTVQSQMKDSGNFIVIPKRIYTSEGAKFTLSCWIFKGYESYSEPWL